MRRKRGKGRERENEGQREGMKGRTCSSERTEKEGRWKQ